MWLQSWCSTAVQLFVHWCGTRKDSGLRKSVASSKLETAILEDIQERKIEIRDLEKTLAFFSFFSCPHFRVCMENASYEVFESSPLIHHFSVINFFSFCNKCYSKWKEGRTFCFRGNIEKYSIHFSFTRLFHAYCIVLSSPERHSCSINTCYFSTTCFHAHCVYLSVVIFSFSVFHVFVTFLWSSCCLDLFSV